MKPMKCPDPKCGNRFTVVFAGNDDGATLKPIGRKSSKNRLPRKMRKLVRVTDPDYSSKPYRMTLHCAGKGGCGAKIECRGYSKALVTCAIRAKLKQIRKTFLEQAAPAC